MSKHLQTEIETLKKKLLTLTSQIERLVRDSVKVLDQRDIRLAREIVYADRLIDQREIEIEEDCLKILALHQPVAIDLRYIVGTIKMNNDLERIGDHAVHIAERAIDLFELPQIQPPFDLKTMTERTCALITMSIDSLINMDMELAKKVCDGDQEIDDIHKEMYQSVVKEINKNPVNANALIKYLSISKHLERIADYATNIAEDVMYMIEGVIYRHQL